MNIAIRKDFKWSWRRMVFPLKGNQVFTLIIMVKRCLLNIESISYVKAILL